MVSAAEVPGAIPDHRGGIRVVRYSCRAPCSRAGCRYTVTANRGEDTMSRSSSSEQVRMAELLHSALLELPIHSVDRHTGVLSLIGELRHRDSVPVLEHFVWLEIARLLPPEVREGESGGSAERMESVVGLQARAAQLLVWVSRGTHLDRVRRILYEHPESRVRLAAIDACAAASGDDPRMLAALRECARVEECRVAGYPRRAVARRGSR